ncbi:uncharacterized protein LOC142169171 [Nicotiana tabacum]|uniref:Uncharacterized protein LOC142169171 n=1 Tax=Nicotiana tabacum TaxID=4097 RepID=A0AC58SNE7_TOBAC
MISQQKYIKELLKRFDTEGSKITDTPISTATHLDMDEPGSRANETMYRGIIGSLLYLTASRPDIVLYGIVFQGMLMLTMLVIWWIGKALLLEDFSVFSDCVPLLCDNTSALNMAKNPVQHKRTKHIDMRHHFLRDNVDKGLICMKFCSIEDQIADIFTKTLSKERFEKNRMALGLIKSS